MSRCVYPEFSGMQLLDGRVPAETFGTQSISPMTRDRAVLDREVSPRMKRHDAAIIVAFILILGCTSSPGKGPDVDARQGQGDAETDDGAAACEPNGPSNQTDGSAD